MTLIKKSLPIISIMLGKQSIDTDIEYRLFSAVTRLDYKNAVLLYNAVTKELISFKKEEYDLKKNSLFANEIPKYLIENYFFVPTAFDDNKLLDQIRPTIASMQNQNNNFYEIFTTTACNARCFYCFEAGMEQKNMELDTAKLVADYIVSQNVGKKVKIEWFGGEPLHNYKVIDLICNRLKENKIDFSTHMITNGSLFNETLVGRAVTNWHLNRVQITLDGTEDVYNRCKNYIDFKNESPFKKVMENIGFLLEANIKISVRLNFDFHNADNLYKLVDYLKSKFSNNSNLFIYTYPLYENCGYKKKIRSKSDRLILINKLMEFENYCVKIGINCIGRLSDNIKLGCMASNQNATVVSVDGLFYRCPHVLDEPPFGGIYSNKKDYDIITSWKEKSDENEYCQKCFNYIDCFKVKKCPHNMPCDEAYRKLQRFKLENKIKKAYDIYLNESLDK